MNTINKFLNLIFTLCLCMLCTIPSVKAEEKKVTLVDSESKVQIKVNESSYEKGYYLVIKATDMTSNKNTDMYKYFDEDERMFAENYKFYDISVYASNDEIVSSEKLGQITVNIPVENNFDEKNLKVLQLVYGQNNDVTKPGTIIQEGENKYFSFETTNLSKIALVDIDSRKTTSVIIWSIIITFVIAGGIVSVYIIKNHKKKM